MLTYKPWIKDNELNTYKMNYEEVIKTKYN